MVQFDEHFFQMGGDYPPTTTVLLVTKWLHVWNQETALVATFLPNDWNPTVVRRGRRQPAIHPWSFQLDDDYQIFPWKKVLFHHFHPFQTRLLFSCTRDPYVFGEGEGFARKNLGVPGAEIYLARMIGRLKIWRCSSWLNIYLQNN